MFGDKNTWHLWTATMNTNERRILLNLIIEKRRFLQDTQRWNPTDNEDHRAMDDVYEHLTYAEYNEKNERILTDIWQKKSE